MPTKQTAKVKQEIVIVMDKSGSMASSREDVIGGFNTYISDLKKDDTIDAKLTFVMFDNGVHKLYSGKEIKQVDELCQRTYNPNGGTALNDAVMEAIEDIETRTKNSKAKNKPQVLLIVFTDGDENSSQKYNKQQVSDKRKEKEAEGWAFIFMGADMDAWAAGRSYGMSKGNTVSLGKQAIGTAAQYLSNRTAKAARLHSANTRGMMDNVAYAQSMSNLMSLDEDDMANDLQAVSLRSTIDSSSKVSPGTQAQSIHKVQPHSPFDAIWTSDSNPAYASIAEKAAEVLSSLKVEKED